ncbi:hypothetical protein G2W53_037935 [Senna tora]|uniref:Uncharacterized protein n=1 Tax=Senna tora TaxID=362788 RepID=A0A834W6C0_9FABA|nr:hypothetical protein G2W53_037935 [Senna tora]
MVNHEGTEVEVTRLESSTYDIVFSDVCKTSMTRQVVPPSPALRRNPTFLANERSATPRGRRRASEIAGVTTAECAAVCCCCPLMVMNILVLAVYKVPAGLCKKAIRRKKLQRLQKKKNKMLLPQQIGNSGNAKLTLEDYLAVEMKKDGDADDGGSWTAALEEEMWTQFHGTGFWRSSSQRQEP